MLMLEIASIPDSNPGEIVVATWSRRLWHPICPRATFHESSQIS